jgi:hypothetical protein
MAQPPSKLSPMISCRPLRASLAAEHEVGAPVGDTTSGRSVVGHIGRRSSTC